eukprot:SAG31_NODE_1177_length_9532_cov_6.655465_5_plen_1084_part_00
MAAKQRHPSLNMLSGGSSIRDRWRQMEAANAQPPAPPELKQPWERSIAARSTPTSQHGADANAGRALQQRQQPHLQVTSAPIPAHTTTPAAVPSVSSASSSQRRHASLDLLSGSVHSNPWLSGQFARRDGALDSDADETSVFEETVPAVRRRVSATRVITQVEYERDQTVAAHEDAQSHDDRREAMHTELEATKAEIAAHVASIQRVPTPSAGPPATQQGLAPPALSVKKSSEAHTAPTETAQGMTKVEDAGEIDQRELHLQPTVKEVKQPHQIAVKAPPVPAPPEPEPEPVAESDPAEADSPYVGDHISSDSFASLFDSVGSLSSFEEEVQQVDFDGSQTSIDSGAESDHLNVRVCTWNCGNAAPPDDLNAWLPRRGGGADIVAICAQEATYGGCHAKEEIVGELHLRMTKFECASWDRFVNNPTTPSTYMAVSCLSENADKQGFDTDRIAPAKTSWVDATDWVAKANFKIFPSTTALRLRIWEDAYIGKDKKAEAHIFFSGDRLTGNNDSVLCQSSVLVQGGEDVVHFRLPVFTGDGKSLVGHATVEIYLAMTLGMQPVHRGRAFTLVPKKGDDHFVRVMSKVLGTQYQMLRGQGLPGQLGQMRLLIFVRNDKINHVHGHELRSQTTGFLGGTMPNKGGLAAKLMYRETSLCFVCAHLAPHEGVKNCVARGYMARRIQDGARVGDRDVDFTGQFDHVFWAGDLNYRVDLNQFNGSARQKKYEFAEMWKTVKSRVDSGDLDSLFEHDELMHEVQNANVFAGFTESLHYLAKHRQQYIPPTFKVLRHRRRGHYVTNRTPSWCDRVLWASMPGSSGCVHLQGVGSDTGLTTSDHKPVYAGFRVAVPKPIVDRTEQWHIRTQSYKNYNATHGRCVVARIINMKATGLSAKGTLGICGRQDVAKCKPAVQFKSYGALRAASEGWAMSGVASNGMSEFPGTCFLPLQGIADMSLLCAEVEDPSGSLAGDTSSSPGRVLWSESLTLVVKDKTGHKHERNGAIIGYGRLALRDPPSERFDKLEDHKRVRQMQLRGPGKSKLVTKAGMVSRDFQITTVSLNGSQRMQGMISGTLQIYTVKMIQDDKKGRH